MAPLLGVEASAGSRMLTVGGSPLCHLLLRTAHAAPSSLQTLPHMVLTASPRGRGYHNSRIAEEETEVEKVQEFIVPMSPIPPVMNPQELHYAVLSAKARTSVAGAALK